MRVIKKTVLIEIAIYTNAVIVVCGGMTVIAQNGFSFFGDCKMHFMQMQVIENELCSLFRNILSDGIKRRFCLWHTYPSC